MSANIDKNNSNVTSAKAFPWKLIVILACLMAIIASFSKHPVAMAAKKYEFVYLPAIFSPAAPSEAGTLVYTVDSGVDREIYTVYANGTGKVRLTNNDAVDDMPAWSADGKLIAFTSDRRNPGSGYYELHTMKRDGSDVERLINAKWDDNSPSFSPIGDKIVYASNRNGVFQIFTINSDGSERRPLTGDDYHSGSPEWSADGSKIVFASSYAKGIEIFVMNPDGSDRKGLTTGGGPDFSPAWSPDGKQIVFTSLRDGERRIYVMNSDGSDLKQLTDFYSDWPDWSPDGTRIVFTRREGGNTISAGDAVELLPIDAGLLFAHREVAAESDTNLYTMKPDGSDIQPLTQSPHQKEDRGNWGL